MEKRGLLSKERDESQSTRVKIRRLGPKMKFVKIGQGGNAASGRQEVTLSASADWGEGERKGSPVSVLTPDPENASEKRKKDKLGHAFQGRK